MPCLPSAAASPTPDSISSCGVWNAPEETITSRRARICFSLLALPVFDADRALAFEQDAGGMRAGLDAQIGAAAHMRMDVGARRTPAFAVLLRHLIDAEAFMLLGIEVLADPELALARALQEDLLHRIVGAQFVDGQRAALAVILAVEIGVVLGALEIGQHVG